MSRTTAIAMHGPPKRIPHGYGFSTHQPFARQNVPVRNKIAVHAARDKGCVQTFPSENLSTFVALATLLHTSRR